MARLPRLFAPNTPHLVMVNFLPIVATNDQVIKNQLQKWLGELAIKYHIAIHGWRITDQQIRFLATPAEQQSLSRLIQSLGRNLAALLGQGAVFEGRYRSALIEPGHWVLLTLIWLESYDEEGQFWVNSTCWPWSSASTHNGMGAISHYFLQDHIDYWALGNTPFERQAIYSSLVSEGLAESQFLKITQAIKGQWALGSVEFLEKLKHSASRRVMPQKRGRPRRKLAEVAANSAENPG